ncbi:hypothetical protein [Rhodovulum sulfidophilum]|uniref:Uncharacterized protein n=1 Tax=Rhodovulum sulfidophilum TaxID=35806 RepID=A0ABS1RQ82_RHOSU|nr:hypothetical protein [Rhodovulum sulfidophilum]MBL3552685.1 hypothetical protein [Rhodovulum sulfidophilum]MBL3576137.1 hypothetical protein [Rhodovulum sulfidophilum]MBL3608230.1 hypothetical protein [Rhodovulum sulfidophilum]MCE8432966.1 hypothetical protein [Rhodovulum sulfidophilum]MCE8456485.1 hypothetical protein [Rhodovulum sulfidophilum]
MGYLIATVILVQAAQAVAVVRLVRKTTALSREQDSDSLVARINTALNMGYRLRADDSA